MEGIPALEALFAYDRKSDLKKLCKNLVIDSRDFGYLIRLGNTPGSDIRHHAIFHQWHPPHLILNEEDRRTIRENGVGPWKDGGRVFGKMSEMLHQRRLSAAHLFTVPQNPYDWHLFYFNQKDRIGDHWEGGSHIHLVNWLTHPEFDLDKQLAIVQRDGRPKVSASIHIRWRPMTHEKPPE